MDARNKMDENTLTTSSLIKKEIFNLKPKILKSCVNFSELYRISIDEDEEVVVLTDVVQSQENEKQQLLHHNEQFKKDLVTVEEKMFQIDIQKNSVVSDLEQMCAQEIQNKATLLQNDQELKAAFQEKKEAQEKENASEKDLMEAEKGAESLDATENRLTLMVNELTTKRDQLIKDCDQLSSCIDPEELQNKQRKLDKVEEKLDAFLKSEKEVAIIIQEEYIENRTLCLRKREINRGLDQLRKKMELCATENANIKSKLAGYKADKDRHKPGHNKNLKEIQNTCDSLLASLRLQLEKQLGNMREDLQKLKKELKTTEELYRVESEKDMSCSHQLTQVRADVWTTRQDIYNSMQEEIDAKKTLLAQRQDHVMNLRNILYVKHGPAKPIKKRRLSSPAPNQPISSPVFKKPAPPRRRSTNEILFDELKASTLRSAKHCEADSVTNPDIDDNETVDFSEMKTTTDETSIMTMSSVDAGSSTLESQISNFLGDPV